MITETITGCLKISGQPDVCAEGHRDFAFVIYSFSVHRHLRRNRKSKKIRKNKKIMDITPRLVFKLSMAHQSKIVLRRLGADDALFQS